MESALLLQLFDEMQLLVDSSFAEHSKFLNQYLHDVLDQGVPDLQPLQPDADEQATGRRLWNLFNLPDELLDLSSYVVAESERGLELKQ